MRKITFLAMVLTLMALSGPAQAAVTFDPATGTGFVGKGDVAQPWGWNNADVTANAAEVTFSYDETSDYRVTCTFVAGNSGNTKVVSNTKSVGIDEDVEREIRKNGNGTITGFILGGYDGEVDSPDAPEIGDSCQNGGTLTNVVELGSTGGGLYAHHPDEESLLLQ